MGTNNKYIVEIDNSCYLSDCTEGDPPRTLLIDNARRFDDVSEAVKAIAEAKKAHPFKKLKYEIVILMEM